MAPPFFIDIGHEKEPFRKLSRRFSPLGQEKEMKSPDIIFEQELEAFRKEAEAGIQFLYAYLAVHAMAADHKSAYQLLNQASLFLI